jgi:hypothetical protein
MRRIASLWRLMRIFSQTEPDDVQGAGRRPALGPDRSRQRGDTSGAGDPYVRFDERGVETEAMVEPRRHRRRKGAAKRYARPTAAAPHLDSTNSRRRLECLKRARNGLRHLCLGAQGQARSPHQQSSVSERSAVDGALRSRWRDLPRQLGKHEAVKRRYYRWIERGVLGEILAALAREADLEWL